MRWFRVSVVLGVHTDVRPVGHPGRRPIGSRVAYVRTHPFSWRIYGYYIPVWAHTEPDAGPFELGDEHGLVLDNPLWV